MGTEIFLDCTTQDVERLRPEMNRLALAFQAIQNEVTREMGLRDTLIITHASLALLQVSAERAGKQLSTPRFVRTIKTAMLVARRFGVGKLGYNPPSSS